MTTHTQIEPKLSACTVNCSQSKSHLLMKIKQSLSKLVAPLLLGATMQVSASSLSLTDGSLLAALDTSSTVIIKVDKPKRLSWVLRILNGMILDEIPGSNLYLISVPSVPLSPPWGVQLLEVNSAISLPVELEVGLLSAPSETAALWYADQPALHVINANEAKKYTHGQGIVVADIDARFDHEHPALASRFVNGYDFVEGNPTGNGALNQSSASYMFEGDSTALNQSSASYMFEDSLFQSSASYMFEDSLFQSSASYMFEDTLFQSSASYMFEGNGIKFLDNSVVKLLTPAGAGLSHGTFTAGVIAATAPDAQIMPLRAFDDEGRTDLFSLAKAIWYAVDNGADVINMSWGTDTDSDVIRTAIQYAASKGVVLVASAGNMNNEFAYYPAAYDEVIAVAATDDLDHKASFSSYGAHVLVSAPGVNIISTYPGGTYGVKSGTSFSAPLVSGQVALMRSLQLKDIKNRVSGTSIEIDSKNPDYKRKLGVGRVDALRSIQNEPVSKDDTSSDVTTTDSNSFTFSLFGN